jgi:hypothetical protein
MRKRPRLLLLVLLLGATTSFFAIVFTALWRWFFHGEVALSGDTIGRLVVLGFVIGSMPVGLVWTRSRGQK